MFIDSSRLRAAFLLLAAFLTTVAARANLITNGGFEATVSNQDVQIGAAPADWTFVQAGDGATFDYCGSFAGTAPAHTGNCVMNFGSYQDASIFQALSTTAGPFYDISFYLGNFFTLAGPADNNFTVTFGGRHIFSSVNAPLGPYQLHTATVQANGPSTVLDFSGFNLPDFTGLDDVSVVAQPTAVTPEPSSWLLLASGLLLAYPSPRLNAGRAETLVVTRA